MSSHPSSETRPFATKKQHRCTRSKRGRRAAMPFQLRNDHFSIRMNTRIRGRASVPALAYTCRCTSRDVCLCLWSYQSLSARQARQQPSWSLTPATPWPPEPIMMPAVTFGHVAEVDNATRRCNIDCGVPVVSAKFFEIIFVFLQRCMCSTVHHG